MRRQDLGKYPWINRVEQIAVGRRSGLSEEYYVECWLRGGERRIAVVGSAEKCMAEASEIRRIISDGNAESLRTSQ